MLKHTFQHIHGIGPKSEFDLWRRGILDWNDLDRINPESVLSGKFYYIKEQIIESKEAINQRDYGYFAKRLPSREHWRIYIDSISSPGSHEHTCAFLDIETAFSTSGEQYISTISLYDGHCIHCFIRGANLWCFPEEIKKYEIIVTYSGKTFDIPFIEKSFDISIKNTHIDLRYVLSGMGIKGGLKKCEKELGFNRSESEGIDGKMAPFLWTAYEKAGSLRHLHTLLAYNIEDVLGLYHIIHRISELKISETPFVNLFNLDMEPLPEMPYSADKKTVEEAKEVLKRLSRI